MFWAWQSTLSSNPSLISHWLIVLLCGVAWAIGCEAPQKAPTTAPDADRSSPTIRYVLADFKRDTHAHGFSSTAETHRVVTYSDNSGRQQRGLLSKLEPLDWLTLDLSDEGLPRPTDFRDIPSITFELIGPPEGGRVRFELVTGSKPHLIWERIFPVHQGLFTHTIDLIPAYERIDLSDLRYVRWQWLGTEPAEILIDNLELREDVHWLTSPPDHAISNQLVVAERGQHLVVGVQGKFELVFGEGRLLGWYDRPRVLAGPQRLRYDGSVDFGSPPDPTRTPAEINLVPHVGLGPHPIPLPANWPDPNLTPPAIGEASTFRAWGNILVSQQRVAESSSARVVIRAVHRFFDETTSGQHRAEHIWDYTIYPTGNVFVSVTSQGTDWPATSAGYAVSLSGRLGFDPVALDRRDGQARLILFERSTGQSDLLWVPYDAGQGTLLQMLTSTRDRWLAALLQASARTSPMETAHWFHFGDCDRKTAIQWRAAYQTPPALQLAAGERVLSSRTDPDRDGFSQSTGTYEVRPSNGRLRLSVSKMPPFGLHLRLHGSAGKEVHAYQSGRLIEYIGRDDNDLAVVSIPFESEITGQVEIFVAEEIKPE